VGKVIEGLIAIAVGVGGAALLFWVLNLVVERLPSKWQERLRPYVFIGPAVALVGLFLLYPLIQTIIFSFYDSTGFQWVGGDNYSALIGSSDFRQALLNNVLWLIFVPPAVVVIGMVVAVLADRLKPRSENVAKSIIFLPMAISFVGAATIWRFVYEARPEGREQIGVLNAFITELGAAPIAWLQQSQGHLNSFLLMVVVLWLQAGFSMVLLSAAIKSVPTEIIEASRVDGATERQVFFRVLLPSIWPTVVAVLTIQILLILKIFDVVYAMTGGQFNTDVVANRFVIELFQFGDAGRAAAIVVFLMIAVIPVMIWQVRQFRRQEALR
jgi:alpha-glucoside transport system permease protein